jgi:hypothetical protein
MLLSVTAWFTQLRARESGAASFRSFAGPPATLRGFFWSRVYQWSAPVFASSLLRAAPQSETFSSLCPPLFPTTVEIAQILFASAQQIGWVEKGMNLHRHVGFVFRFPTIARRKYRISLRTNRAFTSKQGLCIVSCGQCCARMIYGMLSNENNALQRWWTDD